MNAAWWKLLILLTLGLSVLSGEVRSAENSRINPLLQNRLVMAVPGEEFPVIIRMADRVATREFAVSTRKKGSARAQARSGLIRALKDRSNQSQRAVRGLLQRHGIANVKPLWVINGLALKASPTLIEMIASMPEVASIEMDRVIEIPQAVLVEVTNPAEPNIDLVRAQALWALGHSGLGVTVAIMDSGVDANHPDLGPRWRGGSNSWFDPHNEHPDVPTDPNGHGTQVTGLVLGGDNGGTIIGVAPDAQWVGVKIFNDADVAPTSAIHEGFQWLLDPDDNPDTDDAPDIVNNSWGFDLEPDVCNALSLEFQPDIQALKAAGIAVVFSAGNTGPSASSSVAPANYPESFAVGSVGDLLSEIAISNASARGPSACDNSIYPEVVAPGYFVKTSDLTAGGAFPNSYAFVSGTSFAAPHVSGVMALLLGAFPGTPIASLETALQQSAVDLGAVDADNTYGHGLVDALAAFNSLDGQPNVELRLLVPNGGEILNGGGSQTIQWGAYPDATTYDVRLSYNGVNFWNIATGLTETSMVWTVQNVNVSAALIRVVAHNNGIWLANDDSDVPFTIVKGGTVLSPNGGESLTGGFTHRIQWATHPDATTYDVRLSYNGVDFWNIATGLTLTSMVWMVPNSNVDTAIIRIVARSGGSWLAADNTDAPFMIVKGGTVLSPNGGEILTGGTQHSIQWAAHPDATTYDVRLSYNGVDFWNLATNLTEASMLWSVPDNNVDTATIRVISRNNGVWTGADNSDEFFSIRKH